MQLASATTGRGATTKEDANSDNESVDTLQVPPPAGAPPPRRMQTLTLSSATTRDDADPGSATLDKARAKAYRDRLAQMHIERRKAKEAKPQTPPPTGPSSGPYYSYGGVYSAGGTYGAPHSPGFGYTAPNMAFGAAQVTVSWALTGTQIKTTGDSAGMQQRV
eukprot:gene19091-25692_t